MMGTAANRLEAAFRRAYRSSALTAQGGFCKYCFEPLPRQSATADHRVPRARGGADHQHNIAAACQPCNSAKGSMSEAAFLSAVKGADSAHVAILRARFRRRMWAAVHNAGRRIMASVGAEYHGPRKGQPTSTGAMR